MALFPLESQHQVTPVRVCLGDFLGFPGWIPVVEVDAVRFEDLHARRAAGAARVRQRVIAVWENEAWWPTVTAAARS